VVHCVSQRQARRLATAIADRLAEVGLRLHPTKTRIVYCKDGKRRLDHQHTSFTFLGFTFAPAGHVARPQLHGVSARDRQRRLAQGQRTGAVLAAASAHRPHPRRAGARHQPDRARLDAVLRRVLQLRAASLLKRINAYLLRWLRKKYKRLHGYKRAKQCWDGITRRDPGMFAHWQWNRAAW
jgi:hypothetical protein